MLNLELQQLEYETHRNLTKKIKALSDEPIRYGWGLLPLFGWAVLGSHP